MLKINKNVNSRKKVMMADGSGSGDSEMFNGISSSHTSETPLMHTSSFYSSGDAGNSHIVDVKLIASNVASWAYIMSPFCFAIAFVSIIGILLRAYYESELKYKEKKDHLFESNFKVSKSDIFKGKNFKPCDYIV